MTGRTHLLLACVMLFAAAAPAQERLFGPIASTILDNDFFQIQNGENAKGKDNGNGNGKAEEGPEHIRDNGMLVEEAVNQEPGVVQHIFNFIHAWNWPPEGRKRDLLFTYTMELPLGSQKHQFSFILPFLSSFSKAPGEPPIQEAGLTDVFLNYRYQLLANDEFLWCAPRATLIVPTGDERFGTGTGQLGYQFNLPVSRYTEMWDYHFNAGATHIPRVSLPLDNGLRSPRHDLSFVNLGASVYYKPSPKFHVFVEVLALWGQQIDDFGDRDRFTQVFLNPAFRCTLAQLEGLDWVIGLGMPIGLTRDTPDISLFAYMSIEHAFRKMKNGSE